jgi:hypothetical protein
VSALFAALVLVATAIVSPQAIGADDDKVYLVTYAKFKPGKAPLALQIIRERFQPVDKRIGRRVLPFDYVTGDWDHIVYFPFDLARMDTIPSGDEWMKALAAQEGGMEQAQQLWQDFWDLVAHSKTEIARLPRTFAP